MVILPAPADLSGDQLAQEIADALGATDVSVALSGDRLEVEGVDDEAAVQAVVDDHAPVHDVPLSPEGRVAALEARLDAVAALAEKANATAQEVAVAAKPSGR